MREVLIAMPKEQKLDMVKKYTNRVPETLTSQFTKRREKRVAKEKQKERGSLQTPLYPPSKCIETNSS